MGQKQTGSWHASLKDCQRRQQDRARKRTKAACMGFHRAFNCSLITINSVLSRQLLWNSMNFKSVLGVWMPRWRDALHPDLNRCALPVCSIKVKCLEGANLQIYNYFQNVIKIYWFLNSTYMKILVVRVWTFSSILSLIQGVYYEFGEDFYCQVENINSKQFLNLKSLKLQNWTYN